MVIVDTTTALQQDDSSALIPNGKDTDSMNTEPTQRSEELTQHSEDCSDGDEFANDNHDDGDNDDDDDRDDDSESSEDSGAEGERAFGAFKSSANANSNGNKSENEGRSIRRSNSWTSFLTRSERHREQADEPPTQQEVAARKVRFRDDPELEEVRILELDPPLTSSEKRSCHGSSDDQDRMEMEVQMTLMRWDNHEDGKIEFDDNRHSIRGLIEHVDEQCPERNRDGDIYHHMTRVLQEQVRQLTSGAKTLDQERVGEIARESALKESQRAQYIAQKDRIEAEEAWKAKPPSKKKLINHAHGKKGASGVEKKKRWGEEDKTGKSPGDNSSKPQRHSSPIKEKKKGIGKLLFWK
jgi:hypothetical protein